MVKTSRDSFLKVKEVQDDLDAISLLGEKGLTPNQIADSIEKINGLQASASEINNSIMLVGNIRNYVDGSGGDETIGIKNWLLSGKSLASDENTYIFSEDLVVPDGVI
jgi:hypothetical protein